VPLGDHGTPAALESLVNRTEGLEDFWAVVHVRLHQPVFIDDSEEPDYVVGYYLNLGLRALSDQVPLLLEQAIDDGKIDWEGTEWYPVDPATLEQAVRKRIKPVSEQGTWYRSGRAFYPAEDSDDVSPQ